VQIDRLKFQNVEFQNAEIQNAEIQNVEFQNAEIQNVHSQNVNRKGWRRDLFEEMLMQIDSTYIHTSHAWGPAESMRCMLQTLLG
jgi:hypothetical protein